MADGSPGHSMLTGADILKIPVDRPESLFSSEHAAAGERRDLVKFWHPDANHDAIAESVVAHINALYDEAERRIAAGAWAQHNTLTFDCTDGKTHRFRHRRLHTFELGLMAIGMTAVAFAVQRTHEALFMNGVKRIGSVWYPDPTLKEDHQRYIPNITHMVDTADLHVAVVGKTSDVVLLADLIEHLGGQIPPKHAAWIVSSLLNVACFYQVTGICHNGLSVDTVFASPEFHSAYPIGGWWYSCEVGSPLTHLPPFSHAMAPRKMLADKRASLDLDLECIRAIGRACLGDITGASLWSRTDIPQPMVRFLNLPSSGDAIEDYSTWSNKTLPDSFGPRRFVELPVTGDAVYPKEA